MWLPSLAHSHLILPTEPVASAEGFLQAYSTDDPNITVDPDGLAYVAFASGSIDGPKGIMGSHRPLSHFLQWHSQSFGFNESDRFSMLSGLAHDPLLRDIFTPLWVGATLCIPDQAMMKTLGQLRVWLKTQEISVIHLTPAMSQLLTMTDELALKYSDEQMRLSKLRYAFFGGDVLTWRHISPFREIAPSVVCVNFYGTTETPQAMSYYVIPDQNDKRKDDWIMKAKPLPLGRGIKDVQLLILNASGMLTGIGETGEIHIRTPYLARGYMGDNKSTHLRFIINPFTREQGDRVFKTGDFGRYLNDGTIEFIGRIDNQVKIRGFRVELGEIEMMLDRCPSVNQAVVLASEDESENKSLVAYIVPEENSEPSTSMLRDFLKMKLPEYMVPSVFIMLESLPLTPNGKVDRKALPKPDQKRPELEKEFVAPNTPTEIKLAEIWCRGY